MIDGPENSSWAMIAFIVDIFCKFLLALGFVFMKFGIMALEEQN
jgi:hypothetical protein